MTPPLPIDALRMRSARQDLKDAFDIDTPSGRERLFWWYFCHGHGEMPIRSTGDCDASEYINQPEDRVRQASFLPITRLMWQLWIGSAPGKRGVRPRKRSGVFGILKLFSASRRDREAQHAVLNWYFTEGLVGANLESMLTQVQADALLETDASGTTRIEKLIWQHDIAIRSLFEGPDDPEYREWVRSGGAKRYRLLSHPMIGLAKVPRAPSRPLSEGSLPFGVNLYGHAGARLGVGEDARMAALSLQTAGVPFKLHSIQATGLPDDEPVPSSSAQDVDYAINLFCMAGLETFQLARRRGRVVFDGHFNIGFWPWELSEWPVLLQGCFDLVDEIWASSHFTAEAFRKSTSKPVSHLPMAVTVDAAEGLGRRDFDLRPDCFLFGSALDGNSSIARKNPLAVIRAFQLAFPNDPSAGLIIKGQRVEGLAEWCDVKRAAGPDPRIHLLTDSYSRGRLLDLYRNIDTFVSLHRSEGFGRNIAEAMLLGKPTIVTDYSGNVDFTTRETALMVETKLAPVRDGEYPFAEGLEWGEPNVHDAANAMVLIKQDQKLRTRLATAGQRAVAERFNPEEVGRRYRLVLERIFAQGGRGGD